MFDRFLRASGASNRSAGGSRLTGCCRHCAEETNRSISDPDKRSSQMTTTEQPAPRPIIPARLADLLQRAMAWRFGASVAVPAQATAQPAAEDADERGQAELPWWAAHHPAVSFRGTRPEGDRD
jgi:hypothetical protein